MKKKLSLNKETIKDLSEEELESIFGGISDGYDYQLIHGIEPGGAITWKKNKKDCNTIADPGCFTSNWSFCNTWWGQSDKIVPGNGPSSGDPSVVADDGNTQLVGTGISPQLNAED